MLVRCCCGAHVVLISSAHLQSTGKRGSSRASKRKAIKALVADASDGNEDDNDGSDYDWEADHENVDWSNYPAEYILAVTMKGKYVVKRKGAARPCQNTP